MKLSRYTDYALRVLIYLAGRDQGLASIRQIAQAYAISHNHLMKIVQDLGHAGFVETVRGRGGGLRLARPASAIVIGDVVRHTEDLGDL
ncbi:Rrf2 family transcriptional regulator, partial [Salmonella enterica subsp. enterica serovar Weltevreden]|nr:Rrf2 family transcriptional regulator [Salmonella enterica subsp. enterica serovar Weltevreden]MCH5978909.1 Rrf2 family transcriptional regulator [Salmonella enterica]